MPLHFSNCEEHILFFFFCRESGPFRKGVPAKAQRGKSDALAAVSVGTRRGRVKGGGGTEMSVENN